jgi:enamine deaminase RidA (YjgF/YER057c/UK114 family)
LPEGLQFPELLATFSSIPEDKTHHSIINMSIADQVQQSLRSFDSTLSALESNNSHMVSVASLKDEMIRFKIWSSNIGAHRKGRSSLDFRLRDASHLRDHVSRLLAVLNESLEDGECLIFLKDAIADLSGAGNRYRCIRAVGPTFR